MNFKTQFELVWKLAQTVCRYQGSGLKWNRIFMILLQFNLLEVLKDLSVE